MPTDERALIDEVVRRLAEKHGQLSSQRVATVVQQVYAQFAASRVRGYVPLLVERRADEQLTGREQSRVAAGGRALAAGPRGSIAAAGRPPLPSTAAEVAEACDGERAQRRGARTVLPNVSGSVGRAAELIAQWLTAWSMTDYIAAATAVATRLVEGALTTTDGAFALRLDADGDTVKVSVHHTRSAADGGRKTTAEAPGDVERLAALCRAQGSNPTSSGQVVWALIGPENRH